MLRAGPLAFALGILLGVPGAALADHSHHRVVDAYRSPKDAQDRKLGAGADDVIVRVIVTHEVPQPGPVQLFLHADPPEHHEVSVRAGVPVWGKNLASGMHDVRVRLRPEDLSAAGLRCGATGCIVGAYTIPGGTHLWGTGYELGRKWDMGNSYDGIDRASGTSFVVPNSRLRRGALARRAPFRPWSKR